LMRVPIIGDKLRVNLFAPFSEKRLAED
jgi:hypothetical protein